MDNNDAQGQQHYRNGPMLSMRLIIFARLKSGWTLNTPKIWVE